MSCSRAQPAYSKCRAERDAPRGQLQVMEAPHDVLANLYYNCRYLQEQIIVNRSYVAKMEDFRRATVVKL